MPGPCQVNNTWLEPTYYIYPWTIIWCLEVILQHFKMRDIRFIPNVKNNSGSSHNFRRFKYRYRHTCQQTIWISVPHSFDIVSLWSMQHWRLSSSWNLNLHNYFDYHVCLSGVWCSVSGDRCPVFVRYKFFFCLNHLGITPWLLGLTPDTSGACSPSEGASKGPKGPF